MPAVCRGARHRAQPYRWERRPHSAVILAARIFAARARWPPIDLPEQIRRAKTEGDECGWAGGSGGGAVEQAAIAMPRRTRRSVDGKLRIRHLKRSGNERIAFETGAANRIVPLPNPLTTCGRRVNQGYIRRLPPMSDHLLPHPLVDVLLILALVR